MNDTWASPEVLPPLGEVQVQVWWQDVASADLAAAWSVLNAAERARAERMRAGLPRQELIVARGTLRMLLGRALGREPASLEFFLGTHGKPVLAGGGVCFSVSHSHGRILIALSRGIALGVDLEQIGTVEEIDIADRNFHADEAELIRHSQNAESRRRAFYSCWTLKEAVVKADGRGLSVPLASFSVAGYVAQLTQGLSLPDGKETLVFLGDGPSFSVKALALPDGFAGALAMVRPAAQVDCFRLHGRQGALLEA